MSVDNLSSDRSVERAIAAIAAGRMVIIVDDEDRENEGDLAIAADAVDAASINYMAVEGRGLICAALHPELVDRLQLPLMVAQHENGSGFGTGFTVSVEAAQGVTTGISAADRAHTVRTLVDPASTRADLATPGHIFPLRARAGGVLERRGQTEASVDLARLAGRVAAGVICEVMAPDGSMLSGERLLAYAAERDLPVVSVEALAAWRRRFDPLPASKSTSIAFARDVGSTTTRTSDAPWMPIATSELPTRHGRFRLKVFRDAHGLEHSALIAGDPIAALPLVRLHSECLTGDAFGSIRCDCGEQLERSLQRIAERGTGALLYLRQEGRGIGLANKVRAYALQDAGHDTASANEALGFPADARRYDVAIAMLRALGIERLELLTNNPRKHEALTSAGLEVVARLPLRVSPTADNAHYLRTKADVFDHDLALEPLANRTRALP